MGRKQLKNKKKKARRKSQPDQSEDIAPSYRKAYSVEKHPDCLLSKATYSCNLQIMGTTVRRFMVCTSLLLIVKES